MKKKIIVVLGPTASGKSNLAIQIAKQFNGEIISVDSRQIYKGMDIASNKITKQEMDNIPHYLLDIIDPDQKFNLHNYQQLTFQTIDKIHQKNKLPILVGGTGLYICSIIQNYDIDNDKTRDCPYNYLVFGINPDREELYNKINQRVDKMLEDGSLDEVKQIYNKYKNKKLHSLTGIGYKEIIQYLDQKIDLNTAIEKIKQHTRNYAKRQMTWFRRMEKQGIKIHWNKPMSAIQKLIKEFLL